MQENLILDFLRTFAYKSIKKDDLHKLIELALYSRPVLDLLYDQILYFIDYCNANCKLSENFSEKLDAIHKQNITDYNNSRKFNNSDV